MQSYSTVRWLAFVLLMLALAEVQAVELKGTVIDVIDGDSVRVKSAGGTRYKVQLNGVVAPVTREGITTLRKLILNKSVTVEWQRRDKWHRLVGTIYLDGLNINREMIRLGHGWFYAPGSYPEEIRNSYVQAGDEAQQASRGLWGGEETTPPWEKNSAK